MKNISKPPYGWLGKTELIGDANIPIKAYSDAFNALWKELGDQYYKADKFTRPEEGVNNIRDVEFNGEILRLGSFLSGTREYLNIESETSLKKLVELVREKEKEMPPSRVSKESKTTRQPDADEWISQTDFITENKLTVSEMVSVRKLWLDIEEQFRQHYADTNKDIYTFTVEKDRFDVKGKMRKSKDPFDDDKLQSVKLKRSDTSRVMELLKVGKPAAIPDNWKNGNEMLDNDPFFNTFSYSARMKELMRDLDTVHAKQYGRASSREGQEPQTISYMDEEYTAARFIKGNRALYFDPASQEKIKETVAIIADKLQDTLRSTGNGARGRYG